MCIRDSLTVGESHRFSDERKKNDKDTVSLVSQGVESTISAFYECKRLFYLILQNKNDLISKKAPLHRLYQK